MLKVQCAACGASYEVDPRRVPANGMKMRCPGCGASVHVASPAQPASADLDLELDLPAPKGHKPAPLASPSAGPSLPPIKAARPADPFDLSDVPAVKSSAAKAPRLSTTADGDLADLPATKSPAAERSAAKSNLSPGRGSADADLPAAKSGSAAARAPFANAPQAEADSLDLPAAKAGAAARAPFASTPKARADSLDLQAAKADAPARAPFASDAEPDELDLPAAKPGGAARAPFASTPRAEPEALDLPAPKAKAEPRKLAPDVDLPAAKAKPRAPDEDDGLDLPLPKPRPANAPFAGKAVPADLSAPKKPEVDLPVAKRPYSDFGLDLPMAKIKAQAAAQANRSPNTFSLDPPAMSEAQPAPRKNFAKPASTARMPLAPRAEPPPAESGGTMPKDSLALEPKPFFASAPPVGMFGKLDEVGATVNAQNAPATPASARNDLVDLPAPNDLPAVKRAQPKATALGLGRKDPLELPAEFGVVKGSPFDSDPPASRPSEPVFGEAAREAPPSSELDLPAPRDLPAVKKRTPGTTLGLGLGALNAARDLKSEASADPAPKSMELSLDLPPMSGSAKRAPEPSFDPFRNEPGSGSFGSFDGGLELEPRAPKHDSLGDLEPIVLPQAQTSNTNTIALNTLELAPNDLMLTGESARGTKGDRLSELGLELKGMRGLSDEPAHGRSLGGAGFGELDLGMGREPTTGTLPLAPAPVPLSVSPQKSAVDAEIVPSDEELALRDKRRVKALKRLPAWLVPLALAAGLGTTGVALGLFTDHGYFGVYLLEELLPAAGDPAQVRDAIKLAEQKALSDGYGDVRKSLVMLSDARNEAGLNRDLLARSLLHESLYQLRFGEDAQSAQRSAAILARALERGARAEKLQLARAADAARRGELTQAKELLAASSDGENDPYHALVRGELALLDGKADAAASAFGEAVKRGAGARGEWGLARARMAQGKLADAEQSAHATLKINPRHPAAHTFLAERALAKKELDSALDHTRVALGQRAVDGVAARPSKAERARAYSLEGQVEEQRDHPREAQAAYERALADEPMNVDVLLGSGRMLMRLGRPQDALSRFDSALSARPSEKPDANGRIPLLEAGSGAIQALLALGRPKEALARSSQLLAQFPSEPEVKLWHGHVLMALERWDEAEAAFRETIDKAPKLFAGYVGLSQLLFKRNRPEEGARALSLATGRVDDSAEVRRMLGNSELARNHLPEAVHQFEAALQYDPNDAGALFGLVVTQRKSGAMDAAEKTLARLEKVDPTFPGISLERGLIQESRGAHAEAIATYRAALVQRPNDSELKLRLGAALVTAGAVDEAEQVLAQVLKERPGSAEAEHYLGRVLFARNETAQAAQRFERAVNNDILKAEYHMYLAWTLLEQGNYGGALASVQRAIERDPNLGDARWLLGRIQLRTGQVRDALVNFQAALRLKPGRVEALANMGDAYDELRDSANAIKSYQDALKRAPDRGEWWYRLGQLQLDKGKRDEARVALSEAVMRGDRARDRPSWLADAHRLYGDVLRESKRGAEASDHYRLFLELAPLGHPDRPEIEQLLYQTRDARR